MSFIVDYKAAKATSELADGKYYVRFEKWEIKKTIQGSDYINIWFRIRTDIEQPCSNMVYFFKLYKNKETGVFNLTSLQNLAKFLKLPDGKSYNSITEFLNECNGKVCTITLKSKTRDGYTNQEIIKWEEFSAGVTLEGNQDDLPF